MRYNTVEYSTYPLKCAKASFVVEHAVTIFHPAGETFNHTHLRRNLHAASV